MAALLSAAPARAFLGIGEGQEKLDAYTSDTVCVTSTSVHAVRSYGAPDHGAGTGHCATFQKRCTWVIAQLTLCSCGLTASVDLIFERSAESFINNIRACRKRSWEG